MILSTADSPSHVQIRGLPMYNLTYNHHTPQFHFTFIFLSSAVLPHNTKHQFAQTRPSALQDRTQLPATRPPAYPRQQKTGPGGETYSSAQAGLTLRPHSHPRRITPVYHL